MSRQRFSFGPAADLLKHAKSVRVELSMFRGQLAMEYAIEGNIIPALDDPEDDEEDADTAVIDRPAPEVLAGEILAAFIANAKGGAR